MMTYYYFDIKSNNYHIRLTNIIIKNIHLSCINVIIYVYFQLLLIILNLKVFFEILKVYNMKILKRSFSIKPSFDSNSKRIVLEPTEYYLIECQASGFCLREQLKCYKKQQGDQIQIMGGELIPEDHSLLSFLWMFKYDKEQDTYRIIHARSDQSLSSDDFQCQLQNGSPVERQQFKIQQIKRGIFRIRDHDDNYLSLDGILQPNDYAERDSSQEFAIKNINPQSIPALGGTGFILTVDKERALDLTNASKLHQNQVILRPPTHRMNQRWVFQGIQPEKEKEQAHLRESIDRSQYSNRLKVYIRSALTEQFVSFNRQHKQLMQSSYPEEWRLDPRKTSMSQQNQGQYYIEHVKQHKFLSYSQKNDLLFLSSDPKPWIIPDHSTALIRAHHKQPRIVHQLSL